MGDFSEIWRMALTSKTLSVGSAGGTVVSTGAIGTETYALRLVCPGVVSSTNGVRYVIGGPNDTVTSTNGVMLVPNWIEYVKCSPSQTVYVISNDATTTQTLIVTEMTN